MILRVETEREPGGTWRVFASALDNTFVGDVSGLTELEANDMAQKDAFGAQAQNATTELADIATQCDDLVSTYFSRGYDGGGANPITDDDLAALSIDAADLASFITLAQQIGNFLGNVTVVTGDYQSIVNVMRTDI